MDYKELIKSLKEEACHQRVVFGSHGVSCQLEGAADAIEALLVERDAAVEDLRLVADCTSCKWYFSENSGETCPGCDCPNENENWEWRGPQKGEPHGE